MLRTRRANDAPLAAGATVACNPLPATCSRQAHKVLAMSSRRSLPLLALVLLLLTPACARVHPHMALPPMALGEPSFFPTLEAYASAPIVGGNRSADLSGHAGSD